MSSQIANGIEKDLLPPERKNGAGSPEKDNRVMLNEQNRLAQYRHILAGFT